MIAIEVGRIAEKRVRGIIPIEGWTSWHAARDAFGFDMTSTLTSGRISPARAVHAG